MEKPLDRQLILGGRRVDTVAALRSHLERATGDRVGGTVVLLGDSGVGKTRLAQEGRQIAEELGMVVLEAQCVDQHAEPLLPLRDATAARHIFVATRRGNQTGPTIASGLACLRSIADEPTQMSSYKQLALSGMKARASGGGAAEAPRSTTAEA